MRLGKHVLKKHDIDKPSLSKFKHGGWCGIVVYEDRTTGDMCAGRTQHLARYLNNMNFGSIKRGQYGKFAQCCSFMQLNVYYMEVSDHTKLRDTQNDVSRAITAKKKKPSPQQSFDFKPKIIRIEEMKLKAFAKKYKLSLTVRERSPSDMTTRWRPELRFYASFDNADIKNGPFVSSNSGDGATPEKAIENYVKNISEKLLVLHAFSKTHRVEIKVPKLAV